MTAPKKKTAKKRGPTLETLAKRVVAAEKALEMAEYEAENLREQLVDTQFKLAVHQGECVRLRSDNVMLVNELNAITESRAALMDKLEARPWWRFWA